MEIDVEKIEACCKEAYNTAKAHGFHSNNESLSHYLILIVTEISEAVQADRKGRHCLNWNPLDDFEASVKDTFEDELADVVIRCCDMLGMLKVSFTEAFRGAYIAPLVYPQFTDNAWEWFNLLVDMGYSVAQRVASLIASVFAYCKGNGIDLETHIDLKMEYNRTRPFRNGCKY